MGRGRIRISGGADGAGRGRGAGRRRRHCHHAVLGADFSGIETCTNLRSARNWARLTATGGRYMKASSILETIGDTTHFSQNRLFGSAEVWLNTERSNTTCSIKDQ